jgi:phage replication O-like protein O
MQKTKDGFLTNRYTKIPNQLLQLIIKTPFTLNQSKTFLALIRCCYGYNKERVPIRRKYLLHLTGFKHNITLQRSLFQLACAGIIRKYIISRRKPHEYEINRDYASWNIQGLKAELMYKKTGRLVASLRPLSGRATASTQGRPTASTIKDNIERKHIKDKERVFITNFYNVLNTVPKSDLSRLTNDREASNRVRAGRKL